MPDTGNATDCLELPPRGCPLNTGFTVYYFLSGIPVDNNNYYVA